MGHKPERPIPKARKCKQCKTVTLWAELYCQLCAYKCTECTCDKPEDPLCEVCMFC